MTRDASHSTSDIVTVFARQGIAISTIARAMAIPTTRILAMCQRAHENDELQMLPPATPDDPRHSLLVELTNLRAQLDDAQAQLRDMHALNETGAENLMGVAGFTKMEARVASTVARFGRCTKATIYHALYGHLPDDEQREPKIVDVMICKIRRKLRPAGIEITTHWGVGYGMSQEDVVRLRELARRTELETFAVPRVASPSLVPAQAAA
jgi:hypothetical protein